MSVPIKMISNSGSSGDENENTNEKADYNFSSNNYFENQKVLSSLPNEKLKNNESYHDKKTSINKLNDWHSQSKNPETDSFYKNLNSGNYMLGNRDLADENIKNEEEEENIHDSFFNEELKLTIFNMIEHTTEGLFQFLEGRGYSALKLVFQKEKKIELQNKRVILEAKNEKGGEIIIKIIFSKFENAGNEIVLMNEIHQILGFETIQPIKNTSFQIKEIFFWYIEMERADQSLCQIIKQHKKIGFSDEEKTKIFRDLSFSLLLFHINNIVHFDIKPENVVYLKSQDRYALIDFGTSILFSSFEMKKHENDCFWSIDTRVMKGFTKYYASPEIYNLDVHQNKVQFFDPFLYDVYSLGITLMKVAFCTDPDLEHAFEECKTNDTVLDKFFESKSRKNPFQNFLPFLNLYTEQKMSYKFAVHSLDQIDDIHDKIISKQILEENKDFEFINSKVEAQVEKNDLKNFDTPQKTSRFGQINILSLMVKKNIKDRCNIYEIIALTAGFQSLFHTTKFRYGKLENEILQWEVCGKLKLRLYQYGRISGTGIGVLIFPESCPSLAVFEGNFYDFELMDGSFKGQGNFIKILNSLDYHDPSIFHLRESHEYNIESSELNGNGQYIFKKIEKNNFRFIKINSSGKGKIVHFEQNFIAETNPTDLLNVFALFLKDFDNKCKLIISYDYTQYIKMNFELQNKEKDQILIFDLRCKVSNKTTHCPHNFFLNLFLSFENLISRCSLMKKISLKFDSFPAELFVSVLKISQIIKKFSKTKNFQTFKIMIDNQLLFYFSSKKQRLIEITDDFQKLKENTQSKHIIFSSKKQVTIPQGCAKSLTVKYKSKFDDILSSLNENLKSLYFMEENVESLIMINHSFPFLNLTKLVFSKNEHFCVDHLELILPSLTHLKTLSMDSTNVTSKSFMILAQNKNCLKSLRKLKISNLRCKLDIQSLDFFLSKETLTNLKTLDLGCWSLENSDLELIAKHERLRNSLEILGFSTLKFIEVTSFLKFFGWMKSLKKINEFEIGGDDEHWKEKMFFSKEKQPIKKYEVIKEKDEVLEIFDRMNFDEIMQIINFPHNETNIMSPEELNQIHSKIMREGEYLYHFSKGGTHLTLKFFTKISNITKIMDILLHSKKLSQMSLKFSPLCDLTLKDYEKLISFLQKPLSYRILADFYFPENENSNAIIISLFETFAIKSLNIYIKSFSIDKKSVLMLSFEEYCKLKFLLIVEDFSLLSDLKNLSRIQKFNYRFDTKDESYLSILKILEQKFLSLITLSLRFDNSIIDICQMIENLPLIENLREVKIEFPDNFEFENELTEDILAEKIGIFQNLELIQIKLGNFWGKKVILLHFYKMLILSFGCLCLKLKSFEIFMPKINFNPNPKTCILNKFWEELGVNFGILWTVNPDLMRIYIEVVNAAEFWNQGLCFRDYLAKQFECERIRNNGFEFRKK